MKLSRGFLVVILILFVLMVLIEVKIPKRFSWDDYSFSHNDSNPFGSMLVDSLLESSMNGAYEVKNGNLIDAYYDSAHIDCAVLLVDYDIYDYDEDEFAMLLEILRRGQTVILVNDYCPDSLGYLLDVGIDSGLDSYSPMDLLSESDSATIIWEKDLIHDKTRYRFRIFSPYNAAIISDFDSETSKWTPLIRQKQVLGTDIVVAASRNYHKGKLIMMTWEQVFTNYNLLENGGAELLLRLISQVGDKRVVRYDFKSTEEYVEESEKSESPLRVFLDNKSLRWAVYLTLLTIIISMIFTARRKQRVIPVIEPPSNQTLTMVKHIGLMHYRHHDNASLVRDCYSLFSQEIMRKLLVDVNDEVDLTDNMSLLTTLSGVDSKQLIEVLSRLKEISTDYEIILTDKETKQLIDTMNSVTRNF